jgi:hypothetical protein
MYAGNFLVSNERQAIKILEEDGRQLNIFEQSETISRGDFDGYLEEEYKYLLELKNEPVEVSLRIEYVQCLKKLDITQ